MTASRARWLRAALAVGLGLACGPAPAGAQALVWQSYQDAGRRAIDRNCYDEAARLYRAAIEEVTQPGVHEPRKIATSYSDLGYVYTLQRNFSQAEALILWTLLERERLLGPIHPDVADSLVKLGRVYIGQGRFAEAEPPLRRAVPIRTKAFKTYLHPDVAEALELIAEAAQGQGKPVEALALQEKAVEIRRRVQETQDLGLDEDNPERRRSREQLATSLEKTSALLRKLPCAVSQADAIRQEADRLDAEAKQLRNPDRDELPAAVPDSAGPSDQPAMPDVPIPGGEPGAAGP
ncbi:MAG TPA: tetratricopeptide repeat protein [Isosphaeraceae bacterium]|jgi:tetratricopeptide (TPR) repeat protein